MERRSFFRMLGAAFVTAPFMKETFVPSDLLRGSEPIYVGPENSSYLYGTLACETNTVCGEWAGIPRDSSFAAEFDRIMKQHLSAEQVQSLFERDATFYDMLNEDK